MKTALLVICGVIYGLVALLMLGAVLLQESKGGGLAALGGTRAESAFGASNPLRRLTVGLSIVFFVLASVLAIALSPKRSVAEDVEKKKKEGVSVTVPIKDAEDEKDKPEEKKDAKEGAKDAKGGEKAGATEKKPAPATLEKKTSKAGEKPAAAPKKVPAGK